MTTIEDLLGQGSLIKLEGFTEPFELEWRQLYATKDFIEWLDTTLPVLEFDSMSDDLTPLEQFAACAAEYVTGENFLSDRRFKKLKYTPNPHVWELKTVHVRVFGWVPRKDCFVCCYGDSKDTIRTFNLAGRYIAQTKYVIDHIGLEPQQIIQSEKIEDVISIKD